MKLDNPLFRSTEKPDSGTDTEAGAALATVLEDGEMLPGEVARLAELEQIVADNLAHFVRCGMALAEIRDRKLYRRDFDTFEDYVAKRWDLGRSRAYQYIDGASIARRIEMSTSGGHSGSDEMSTVVDISPKNERQVRPLTRLQSPEDQVAAWQEAVAAARDGRVTARIVARVVKQRLGEETDRSVRREKKAVDQSEAVPPEAKKAFWTLADMVRSARTSGNQALVAAARQHLQALLNLLD